MNNKKVYTTSEQRETLIEFMAKHKKLQIGKFSNDFTFVDAKKLWEEISTNLNAMPGATKNWSTWRKTWHDIKGKAKNKKATLVKNFTITGGGSPPDIKMTKEDDMVLQMINPTAIEGHSNIEESVVSFDGTFSFDDEHEIIKIDHEYANVINRENIEPDEYMLASTPNKSKDEHPGIASTSTPYKTRDEHTSVANTPSKTRDEHPSVKEKLKKKIKYSKSDGLCKAATATETLAEQNKSFLELKKWYYEKKLSLKEADVYEKRRIADALDKIANNF